MLNARRVKDESDVEEARKLKPEGCVEPDWANCLLIERDGEIVAVGGIQQIFRIEPGFVKYPRDVVAWLGLICELEGALRAMGAKGYEFYINDRFPRYQEMVEKHFDVTPARQGPGKTYIRKLE